MRARFTTSIAGAECAFSAGTEVSVEGTQYGFDVVPEIVGRQWLASGVLVPVKAALTSAAIRSPEIAAMPAAAPRHSGALRK